MAKVAAYTELTAGQLSNTADYFSVSDAGAATKKVNATTILAAPPAIGGTTPAAGTFTTLKVTTGAAAGAIPVSDADGDLTFVSLGYAEMSAYSKSIPFNITVQSKYHAFCLVTAADIISGLLNGWTFNAGRIVDPNITSEADGTDHKLRIVCNVAHGLTTGDLVMIGKANNLAHDAPTRITTDATNPTTEFLCDDIAYAGDAGDSSATVTKPAYLKAGATAAGKYKASFTIDGTAAGSGNAWKWELNNLISPLDNIVSERTSTNTLTSMTSGGLITVAAGDKIWISGKNSTNTSDYTVKNMNLSLVQIGI